MLPRLFLAAALALPGLAVAATPAVAYDNFCASIPADYDEEPILPGGIKMPRVVCVPILIDIPPAP